jgi:hypothetical protein
MAGSFSSLAARLLVPSGAATISGADVVLGAVFEAAFRIRVSRLV